MEHNFDIAADAFELDLFAEELPDQVQLLSDCLSSLFCVGGCGASSLGSVVSTGSAAN